MNPNMYLGNRYIAPPGLESLEWTDSGGSTPGYCILPLRGNRQALETPKEVPKGQNIVAGGETTGKVATI